MIHGLLRYTVAAHIVTFTLSYFYSIPYAFVLALSGESGIYCVINDFLFSSLSLSLFFLSLPSRLARKGYTNIKDARESGGTVREIKGGRERAVEISDALQRHYR